VEVSRVRGAAYTEFLRRAKKMVAARGRRMRVNLNLDWFRPAHERPGARRLAYPANVEFDWRVWVEQGLMDDAMLRPFARPFEGIFGEDAVAQEMIAACQARGVPVSVNRYVWANEGLLGEFGRVLRDGRFNGFVLYETWAFLRFTPEGGCRFATQAESEADASPVSEMSAETAARVREVCEHWRRVRSGAAPV
jgi:hypothetical protein